MYAEADGEPDPSTVATFVSESGVYPGVDLEQGPNGEILYDSLYAGTINRISFDPGAPTARLTADKEWGTAPLTVHFDAGKSTGLETDTLAYEWDLNGDGKFNDGTDPTQTRTYAAATNVTVAVRVKDEATGKSSVAKLTIYPGDTPPIIDLTQPAPTLTWGVGQPIHFAGSTKENGGAAVEAKNLYWKARLLHCPFGLNMCHEHPLQVFCGGANPVNSRRPITAIRPI